MKGDNCNSNDTISRQSWVNKMENYFFMAEHAADPKLKFEYKQKAKLYLRKIRDYDAGITGDCGGEF